LLSNIITDIACCQTEIRQKKIKNVAEAMSELPLSVESFCFFPDNSRAIQYFCSTGFSNLVPVFRLRKRRFP